MIGRKSKAVKIVSDDELRLHLLIILGMTSATKDEQDVVMRHVRSIARKRFTRYAIPNLPKALARDVQEMRNAGKTPTLYRLRRSDGARC